MHLLSFFRRISALSLIFLFALPASTTYELHDYGFGAGGNNISSSSAYSASGIIGEVSGAEGSSSLYSLGAGLTFTRQANTIPMPSFTNPAQYYNKLNLSINPSNNPSDTTYLVAISPDSFVTTYYVQSDGTISVTPAYLTYAALGGGSGIMVVGLDSAITYTLKVKAMQTLYNQTGFSEATSAATVARSLTYDIDIGTVSSVETSPPYAVDLGALSPGTVTTGTNKIWIDLQTNAEGGGFVYIYGNGSGLISTNASYTITSATGNLGSSTEGFGAQVETTTQSAGGPLIAQSPYSSSGNTVGVVDTSTRTILSSSNVPLFSGRGAIILKAKVATTTPLANDYTTTLTMIASASF